MKPSPRIFLCGTLLLNVVLAVMLMRGRVAPSSPRETSPGAASPAANPETAAGGTTAEPRVVVVPASGSPWQALDRHDYGDCMAALRAAGCPEETIRDIIMAAVSREYRERIATTQSERLRNFKWWRFQQEEGADYDRFLTQDLRRERDRKLNELLGDDWNAELNKALGFSAPDKSHWNFISREKREQVESLTWKYARLEEEVQRKARGGYITEAMQAEKQQLAARKREELAQLLTPRELEELDMRQSPAATWARQKLPEPRSEEEFRAFVKVAQTLDKDVFRENQWNPDETQEQRQERQKNDEKVLRSELAKVLGEERTADLFPEPVAAKPDAPIEEQAEPMRKELLRMAAKEGVSAEAANQVHARMVALLKGLETEYGNLNTIPKEKQAELEKKMKASMEKIFVEGMGEKGRRIFKKLSHEDE